MDKNSDVKAILFETQQKIKRQDESIDLIKSHARTIFGTSSVIIPIFGALQAFSTFPVKWIYLLILAAMGLLYGCVVSLALKILSPGTYYGPVAMDKEVLKDGFMGKSEREVLLQQASNNINAIKLNTPLIEQKQIWAKRISILFAILIGVAVISTVIPKFFPAIQP